MSLQHTNIIWKKGKMFKGNQDMKNISSNCPKREDRFQHNDGEMRMNAVNLFANL